MQQKPKEGEMTMRWLRLVLVLTSVSLAACSDEDDETAGDCPSIAGNWLILQHCESSSVGLPVSVAQNACSVSAVMPGGLSSSGSVTPGGGVTMITLVDANETVQCVGSLVGSNLSMNCTSSHSSNECRVVLTR
jgi:hypothetical protein